MIKRTLKTLLPLSAIMLALPAMADWPVAIADNFVVHPVPNAAFSTSTTILDVLRNDVGDNLKVVDVNAWSENGAKISIRSTDDESRFLYHKYGNINYIPKEGFVGNDGFWYVIEDDQGRKNAIRVVVEVKAASTPTPLALEDFVEVPKNKSIRINALANDLFTDSFNSPAGVTFRGDIVDFTTTSQQGGKVEKVEIYADDTLSFGPVRFGGFSLPNTLKYHFKYTPPTGFVGVDTFTYAVKDSKNENGRAVTDSVSWTKVTINVGADTNVNKPWPTAKPDKADLVATTGTSAFNYYPRDIDVLKNDTGENLLIKLGSAYSQNGARVKVVPNYPNRPVIEYTPGADGPDRIWYNIEDEYGRQNFSYVDVNVTR